MSILNLRYIYIQKTFGYEIERKKTIKTDFILKLLKWLVTEKTTKKEQNTLLYKIKHKTHLSTWQATMLPVNRRQ